MGQQVTMAWAIGVSLCVLGSAMTGPSAAREAAALSGVVLEAQRLSSRRGPRRSGV